MKRRLKILSVFLSIFLVTGFLPVATVPPTCRMRTCCSARL